MAAASITSGPLVGKSQVHLDVVAQIKRFLAFDRAAIA